MASPAAGIFRGVHVVPPSILLYTPLPTTSPPVYCSPVPTYQILELLGSTVIEDTARFPGTFSTRAHCEPLLEISVFFHKPPLTPPAKTVLLLLSLGSNKIARVLPPTLFGPLSSHALVPSPIDLFRSRSCFSSSLNKVSLPSSNLPVNGLMVNSHSCSKYLLGGKPFNFRSFLLQLSEALNGLSSIY